MWIILGFILFFFSPYNFLFSLFFRINQGFQNTAEVSIWGESFQYFTINSSSCYIFFNLYQIKKFTTALICLEFFLWISVEFLYIIGSY